MVRTFSRLLMTAVIAVGVTQAALAQEVFPSKPVKIVVPYTSGSGDTLMRIVAQRLSSQVGQQFIVENRPGAAGSTGAAFVARSAPDGYTLVFTAAAHSLMATMQPQLKFDAATELAPVGFMVAQPFVLLARIDAPYKTVAELVAYAKANPGQVKLAHSGVGTLAHTIGRWLSAEAGIDVNEIPFGGSGQGLNSLLGGHTDLLMDPPSNSLPHVAAGKVRAIAVTGGSRIAAMKDVPTLKEQGFAVVGVTWYGLSAPAKTPQPIIARLNKELNAALADAEVKQKLEAMLFSVEPSSPEGYAKFFNDQATMWSKVIRDNKLVVAQ